MEDINERRFTQILFQEAPSISEDVAKEASTAFGSYAPEGVRLKKKKETLDQKFYNGTIEDIGTEACH